MSDNTKVEEIRKWVLNSFVLFNDPSRSDEFHSYFAPEYTNFYLQQGLLSEGWMSKEELRALYDSGMKPNLRVRHLTVQLYDTFAICLMYAEGTVTDAAGNTRRGPWRVTSVIVPHGDSWRAVHNHWSKLET